MHPELTLPVRTRPQMTALRRDARRYRRARAASVAPPQPVRTAIQLRLSACREELERLAPAERAPLHEGDWIVADVERRAGRGGLGRGRDDGLRPVPADHRRLSRCLKLRRKQVLAAAY